MVVEVGGALQEPERKGPGLKAPQLHATCCDLSADTFLKFLCLVLCSCTVSLRPHDEHYDHEYALLGLRPEKTRCELWRLINAFFASPQMLHRCAQALSITEDVIKVQST